MLISSAFTRKVCGLLSHCISMSLNKRFSDKRKSGQGKARWEEGCLSVLAGQTHLMDEVSWETMPPWFVTL